MQILFEDDHLIAVNKPNGIFVHRTSLDPEATVFVVQEVRNIVGKHVYPVHRLDRKTSGVIVLAKSKEVQSELNSSFRDREIEKSYLAIVRGYTDEKGHIDYPLTNDSGKIQEALTDFETLQHMEIDLNSGTFPTSRYSLIRIFPLTGRRHQIRRHLAHILHPIIGDRPHGCNKQNRFFLAQYQMNHMLLHAEIIKFVHPISRESIEIQAPLFGEFERMMDELGFSAIV
ncbi:MAG: pseudouridylate synthase [Saprospiraceae bacterium]|nr:pseudouridylate synthase [Saprospiraceae bacterium]